MWLRFDLGGMKRLFFLVPPVTALIAWPLFGETLTLKSVSGMALVVVGILLVRRKQDDEEGAGAT